MTTFIVPVTWTMYGEYKIEAETVEEAIEKAEYKRLLPKKQEYIEGSVKVDETDIKYLVYGGYY